MNKLTSKIIKEISNQNISIEKNYKLLRVLQKVINPSFFNSQSYEDVIFPLQGRSIKARVFNNYPNATKLLIFIHGGGWVTGDIGTYTSTCLELSKRTQSFVIAIDYRLAPEYPFPNGFNDCYEVVKIIMDNIGELGVSSKDVCLIGDSAGGNLVAAISLKSRCTKEFKITQQILLYPALQTDYSNRTKYRSVIEKGQDYLLTQKQLQEYISLYITNEEDLNNPYAAPLLAKSLFFQPKTLIITCDNDPLRDEGKSYYLRLKRYFNKVTYYNFEGARHGFLSHPLERKYTLKAYDKIADFLGVNYDKKR